MNGVQKPIKKYKICFIFPRKQLPPIIKHLSESVPCPSIHVEKQEKEERHICCGLSALVVFLFLPVNPPVEFRKRDGIGIGCHLR